LIYETKNSLAGAEIAQAI